MAAYQVIKELNVDVAKRNLFQAIVAKQYDRNTRFLKITLMNEGNPIIVGTDSFVTINARRADETSGAFAGSVNDDGSITVPLSPWMLQLDDTVKCDVSIIDPTSNDKLTSISFDIEVERAAHGNDDITEDENYDILISLIADVSTAIDAANEAADRANAAAGGGGSSGGTIVIDDTDYYKVDLSQYSLVQGTISTTGADTDSNAKRYKMRYPVFVYAGTKIKFENDDTDKSATLHIYDLSTNSSGYSWTECVTEISEYTADRDCYIRLVFLNGNDNITDGTYAEMLSSISILSPLPPLQQIEGEPMPYFAQEIRDVSKRVGAETGLKLSVITDAHCYYPRYGNKNHLSYTHFRNVKAVADKTHVDAIVNLGDNTFGYSYGDVSRDIHAMLSKWSKSLSAPYLQVDGNHDENHYYAFASTRRYNQLITPQELASYYYHQNDDNQRSYFYHDIPEQHTRIIVLNANDAYVLDESGNPKYNKEETNAIAATYAYMPQQVEWLADLLHETEKKCAGWDVVICSHQSVCPTGSGSTQVPKNTEVVWGLLTAFNGGTTYAKDITDGDFSVSVNETYEGKCQIPCALHGHKHYDRAFKEGGIWNICIAASVCVSGETSDEGATVPERTPYTATEDAWDVCCIDTDSIKMVRFGAGEDRAFTRDKAKFEVVESGGTLTDEKEWQLIRRVILDEDVQLVSITDDSDGKPFSYDEIAIRSVTMEGSDDKNQKSGAIWINDEGLSNHTSGNSLYFGFAARHLNGWYSPVVAHLRPFCGHFAFSAWYHDAGIAKDAFLAANYDSFDSVTSGQLNSFSPTNYMTYDGVNAAHLFNNPMESTKITALSYGAPYSDHLFAAGSILEFYGR